MMMYKMRELINKEDDQSIILEGEISDTDLDGEVDKFVDSMNTHIAISKSLGRRIDLLGEEIKTLHEKVKSLQEDLLRELKMYKNNQYMTLAFSASFVATMLFYVKKIKP